MKNDATPKREDPQVHDTAYWDALEKKEFFAMKTRLEFPKLTAIFAAFDAFSVLMICLALRQKGGATWFLLGIGGLQIVLFRTAFRDKVAIALENRTIPKWERFSLVPVVGPVIAYFGLRTSFALAERDADRQRRARPYLRELSTYLTPEKFDDDKVLELMDKANDIVFGEEELDEGKPEKPASATTNERPKTDGEGRGTV